MALNHSRDDMPAASASGRVAVKRQTILAGALTVFAREGFARASIGAIAAEANVSTRTIYNHFACKLHLFQTVIHDSASEVAGAQIALIDRYLGQPDDLADLETALTELGTALASPMGGMPVTLPWSGRSMPRSGTSRRPSSTRGGTPARPG